jgi:hypothetical protein
METGLNEHLQAAGTQLETWRRAPEELQCLKA